MLFEAGGLCWLTNVGKARQRVGVYRVGGGVGGAAHAQLQAVRVRGLHEADQLRLAGGVIEAVLADRDRRHITVGYAPQ
jgi:hypothetical protein